MASTCYMQHTTYMMHLFIIYYMKYECMCYVHRTPHTAHNIQGTRHSRCSKNMSWQNFLLWTPGSGFRFTNKSIKFMLKPWNRFYFFAYKILNIVASQEDSRALSRSWISPSGENAPARAPELWNFHLHDLYARPELFLPRHFAHVKYIGWYLLQARPQNRHWIWSVQFLVALVNKRNRKQFRWPPHR